MPKIDLTNELFTHLFPGFAKSVVIIANGEIPSEPYLLNLLQTSQLKIACDGAINALAELVIGVDYVVGDGDSIDLVKDYFTKHPYIKIPDQNTNDLTKAFNLACELAPEIPIIIYGASGKREDHSMANFALLNNYAKKNPNMLMISDYGVFSPLTTELTQVNSIVGQQISFFSMRHQSIVTCQELKWPLINFELNNLYGGSLNQATDTVLNIQSYGELVIYRAFEQKI